MIQSFLDTVTLSTGTAGTTQVRTGFGFQPKCFFGLAVTSSASTLMSFGGGIGATTHRSTTLKNQNGTNPTTTAAVDSSARMYGTYGTGAGGTTIAGDWDVSAIGSDGLTLRVVTQYTFETTSASMLALGGPGIRNVALGSITAPGSPGTSTVSGLGFAPDTVVFWKANAGGASFGAACKYGPIGASTSGSTSSGNVGTSFAKRYSQQDECITSISGGGVIQRGQVSAWNSDGFTVNWVETSGLAVQYMAIECASGFGSRILTGTTPVTDGTMDLTTTGEFTPLAGLVCSTCSAQETADTFSAGGEVSLGFFSGILASASVYRMDDAATNSSNVVHAQYVSPASAAIYARPGSALATITSLSKNTISSSVTNEVVASYVWSLAFGTVPPIARGGPLFF